MSEINKVYKKYGEIAGKQYLVIFCSSLVAATHFENKSDDQGLSEYKNKLNEFIRKEYGQDFFVGYSDFARDADFNQKLKMELYKRSDEFISKRIVDLEKGPNITTQIEKKESRQTKPASVDHQSASANSSRTGYVNLDGARAEFSYDEPDKAIPLAKSAVFCRPHDAENWCALGELYGEKNDWKTASEYFDKAIEKNPKLTRAISDKKKANEHLKMSGTNKNNLSTADRDAQALRNGSETEDVTYFFENQQEFLLYVALNKDKVKGNIVWADGSRYMDAYKRGYNLFGQKQFVQAINAYKAALEVNPVGVAARFEICSAYCQLGDLAAAKEALKSIEPYVYSDGIIARYYRQWGYILVEEKDYKTAANAYQYSLFYEPDMQSAKQEILFIVNEAGFDVLDGIKDRKKVERTLENAGIPLLKTVL